MRLGLALTFFTVAFAAQTVQANPQVVKSNRLEPYVDAYQHSNVRILGDKLDLSDTSASPNKTNLDQTFFTCTDNGWEYAEGDTYSAANFNDIYNTLNRYWWRFWAATQVYCLGLTLPPLLIANAWYPGGQLVAAAIAFGVCNGVYVPLTMGMAVGVTKNKMEDLANKSASQKGWGAYRQLSRSAGQPVVSETYIHGIMPGGLALWTEGKPKVITYKNFQNYTGIHQNGTKRSPKPTDKAADGRHKNVSYRPVSNSADSLCHLIRCGKDIQSGDGNLGELSKIGSMGALTSTFLKKTFNGLTNALIFKTSYSSSLPEFMRQHNEKSFQSCQVFSTFSKSRFDATMVQNLKSYIGLEELKKQQYIADKKLQPSPFQAVAVGNSISSELIDLANLKTEPTLDLEFFKDTLINRTVNRSKETILANRLTFFCSKIEANMCQPVSLNFTTPGSSSQENSIQLGIPNDLLMNSLYGHSRFSTTPKTVFAHNVLNKVKGISPVYLLPVKKIRKPLKEGQGVVFEKGGAAHLASKYYITSHLSMAQLSAQQSFLSRVSTIGEGGETDKQSQQSIAKEESTRRFKDAAWYQMMSVAGREQVTREWVLMLAQSLEQKYDRYRQLERLTALNAAHGSLILRNVLSEGQHSGF